MEDFGTNYLGIYAHIRITMERRETPAGPDPQCAAVYVAIGSGAKMGYLGNSACEGITVVEKTRLGEISYGN